MRNMFKEYDSKDLYQSTKNYTTPGNYIMQPKLAEVKVVSSGTKFAFVVKAEVLEVLSRGGANSNEKVVGELVDLISVGSLDTTLLTAQNLSKDKVIERTKTQKALNTIRQFLKACGVELSRLEKDLVVGDTFGNYVVVDVNEEVIVYTDQQSGDLHTTHPDIAILKLLCDTMTLKKQNWVCTPKQLASGTILHHVDIFPM